MRKENTIMEEDNIQHRREIGSGIWTGLIWPRIGTSDGLL
jgi:hypothetical protein